MDQNYSRGSTIDLQSEADFNLEDKLSEIYARALYTRRILQNLLKDITTNILEGRESTQELIHVMQMQGVLSSRTNPEQQTINIQKKNECLEEMNSNSDQQKVQKEMLCYAETNKHPTYHQAKHLEFEQEPSQD